jgi:nucleoside-diphosphate-sugar epimerase
MHFAEGDFAHHRKRSLKIDYRPNCLRMIPKVRQPDITLARKLLGWEPQVPFEEGISRTDRVFSRLSENPCLMRGAFC